MNQGLFSLQGEIRLAKRQSNGKPGVSVWAGNVPEAVLNLGVTTADKKESFSGSRGLYGRMYSEKSCTFSGTFDEWSLRTLALMLHSVPEAEAGGSVTGDVFPTGLVAGDIITLDEPYASALVISDNTDPTPQTVDPDDYEFVGHNQRSIRLLSVTDYVQPLSAAYTAAAYNTLGFFNSPPEEVYVVFDGIDTESGQPVLIDLFRTQFDPFANLALINEEFGSLPFNAAVMFDPRNIEHGGYARWISKVPA